VAIALISTLFISLYLGAVILLHRSLAPLRQVVGLLREVAPSQKDTKPATDAV
jgi:hypothetical protein